MKLFLLILSLVGPIYGELPPYKELTLKKIRTYCRSCHAVEDLRFIRSDNNEELWATIFNEKSPKSGEIWVKKIIETLSWPTNEAPPFDTPMSPTGDWMPKGFKRLSLAEDYTEGIPTRVIILETLKAGQ